MPRGAEGHASRDPRRALTGSARGWLVVLAGAALAGRLWTLQIAASGDAAGLFHDGGVYLVTARALAEDGRYRLASAPGAPPAVRYPPLFPALLAAVWRGAPRFPDNLPLLKGIGLCAALGLALVLPGALGAAGVPPAAAVATAFLTVTAPLTMRYATAIASELPFALLALVALWAVEASLRPGAGARRAACAGIMAALAFLTRSVGIVVVAAGLASLLRRGDRRRALAFALSAAPALAAWACWLAFRGGHGGTPGYAGALLHDGVPGPVTVLGHLGALPAAVGLVTLPGVGDLLPPAAPWPALLAVYACGMLALIAALRRPFGVYVGLTLAVAVVVPWFQPRFLVPLAPLFLAALLAAACPAGAGRRRRLATGAAVLVLAGLGLAGNQVRLAQVRATGLPALDAGRAAAVSWTDIAATTRWLHAHTTPDDVLASFDDPLVSLYTDRRVVQAYPALWRPDPRDVSLALAHTQARYLVDIPCPSGSTWAASHAVWTAWLVAHAADLTPVYESPAGSVRVWRVADTLTR